MKHLYAVLPLLAAMLAGCPRQAMPDSQPVQATTRGTAEPQLTRLDGDPYADCASPQVRRLVELANAERQPRELPTLYCDRELDRVALVHAEDMCQGQFISHSGSDGSSPADRADRLGVAYMALAENVAWGQRTPEHVHDNWMGSAGHRRNILGEVYSRLGAAVVDCGGQPFWVQVFAN